MKGVTEDESVCLGPEYLHRRALENPTDFYKIAARLIPAAVQEALECFSQSHMCAGCANERRHTEAAGWKWLPAS